MTRLKIPEAVGAKYHDFGILLLDDTLGDLIRNIEAKHQRDSSAIVTDILREWFQGRGLPVTWKSLIKTLRDMQLNVQAKKLEDTYGGVYTISVCVSVLLSVMPHAPVQKRCTYFPVYSTCA